MIATPRQPFNDAKKLASAHNLFVREQSSEYLLYRRMPTRAVYIGKRSTPETLLAFVRKVIKTH